MIQMRPTINAKFRRDAWLEINLAALERNLERIHATAQRPLIPVLKADAYGHGAAVLVKTLDAFPCVHAYAVASADEALNLREHTNKPIMLLGISPQWAYQALIDADIEITIVDLDEAIKLSEITGTKKAKVHLKLDTGMHRIGFNVVDSDKEWRQALSKIESLNNIVIRSVFSHFAGPSTFNAKQLDCFLKATEGLAYARHIASSGSVSDLPESRLDFVRCGIELYGHSNNVTDVTLLRLQHECKDSATTTYEPLLSLYARISFIKKISKDDTVSYQGTWTAPRDTYIATLPLGYADGVPRALSNKMQAYVQGTYVPQTGMVTMDQLMLDLGSETKAKVGDLVELIGPHIPVGTWASNSGTISYEILTGLNLRLPKVYTRN